MEREGGFPHLAAVEFMIAAAHDLTLPKGGDGGFRLRHRRGYHAARNAAPRPVTLLHSQSE